MEANVLVTAPEAGRRLCLEAITKYVSEESVQLYREALEFYVAQLTEAIRDKLTGRCVLGRVIATDKRDVLR